MTLPELSLALRHLATTDGATPAQIGSFLTGFRLNGFDRRADVLAAFATVMRELAIEVEFEKQEGEGEGGVCDIVGTGGDGQNTFNVSTTAGIVVAGAGMKVYKVRYLSTDLGSCGEGDSSRDLKLHLYCRTLSVKGALEMTQLDRTARQQSSDLFLRLSRHPSLPRNPNSLPPAVLPPPSILEILLSLPLRPPVPPSNVAPRPNP